jgi:hypothetical protein
MLQHWSRFCQTEATSNQNKAVKSKNLSRNKLHKMRLAVQREKQKTEGFFDGRFVQRTEESAKKYKRKQKHKHKAF